MLVSVKPPNGPKVTHIVFIRGRNGIDELLGSQIQLAGIGILDRMAVEASLGLERQLRFLFSLGPHEGALDRLLHLRDLGHDGGQLM